MKGSFGRQGLLVSLHLCFRLCEQISIEVRVNGLNLTPLRLFEETFLLRDTPQFMEMSETEFDCFVGFGVTVVFSQDGKVVVEGWSDVATIPT